MAGMLKQAQQMQAQMKKMNAKLEAARVEGNAGGGMVVAECTGTAEFISISIDPSLYEEKDKDLLESLVLAAINDARDKAQVLAKEGMEAAAAEMGIPPGLFSGEGIPGLGI
jgi:hypothetical protein